MAHGITANGIYYKHEKESSQLRMAGGAWSINLKEVDFDKVHTIVFLTDKSRWEIPAFEAIEYGFQRNFKGEDKLVVPLKYWRRDAKD